MSFIETITGHFVSSAEVTKITPLKRDGGLDRCLITVRGEQFEVRGTAEKIAARNSYQFLVAQPGYFLSVGALSEMTIDEAKEYFVPIIAWRFSPEEDWPTPITADGPNDGFEYNNEHLIIHPTGWVTSVCNEGWSSIEIAHLARTELKKALAEEV